MTSRFRHAMIGAENQQIGQKSLPFLEGKGELFQPH